MIKQIIIFIWLFLFFVGGLSAQSPIISSFSPISGPVGTLVTISGTSLNNITALNIGGVTAITTSNTSNQIVGMVMPGAVSGVLTITTLTGTATSTSNFAVTNTPLPTTQQGSKLAGTGYTGNSSQGQSVAISADGNTAIVGGPQDNNSIGAAWIYVFNGTSWVQQGSKLVGTTYVGQSCQGYSVAISADGNTAMVGGYKDNFSIGAVWIYIRINGVWTQQGEKIVPTDVGPSEGLNPEAGYSVALSADGNTALVGADFDNNGVGAANVYIRSKGVWKMQGPKLVGTGAIGKAAQGRAVALSADGNTALVSGQNDNSSQGAVWAFSRTAGKWNQQGAKIAFTNDLTSEYIGSSVALSADGNVGVVGANYYNSNRGITWMLTRVNDVWQIGDKLFGTDGTEPANQGISVSVSADGSIVTIGGYSDTNNKGATWLFGKNGSTWSQQGAKIVGTGTSGSASQGQSVAISANGNVLFSGGSTDNGGIGAVWPFAAYPIATTQPATLITATTTTINGYVIDNKSSTSINLQYDTAANLNTAITVLPSSGINPLPPGTGKSDYSAILKNLTAGKTYYYRINATNANGTSYGMVYNFKTVAGQPSIDSFNPASGAPGTLVTITGSNLDDLTDLFIGNKAAIIVTNTGTQLVGMVMPGDSSGAVTITTPGGSDTTSDNFAVTSTPYPNLLHAGPYISNVSDAPTVVVSADGNTAVISGPFNVYTRENGIWSVQTTLKPTNTLGNKFYTSITLAISADGNTIVLGSEGDDNYEGAAYVFTRNNGVWTQQGGKLVGSGSVGYAQQGSSVALSADGNTAAVSGNFDNNGQGAVWIFTRSGDTWSQQGDKIPGTNPSDGDMNTFQSVGLSADGKTLIIGDSGDNNGIGAASIYNRSGQLSDMWIQQTKLVGSNNIGASYQGQAVALSADGNVAILGAPEDGNTGEFGTGPVIGAAWVFTRKNGKWNQNGTKLIGTTALAGQGTSVTLSADGRTAAFGGATFPDIPSGSAWVFTFSDSVWTARGDIAKVTGTAEQGNSVSLSADGTTFFVSGRGGGNFNGEVCVYGTANIPAITSFTPTLGTLETQVHITGNNFTGVTNVSFGGYQAASFTVDSATSITAYVGIGKSGNVTVTTPGGVASLPGFVFVPIPTILAVGTTTFPLGDSVILTANPDTGAYIYQWMKEGVIIPGADKSNYVALQSGQYTVSITLNGITQTSVETLVNAVFTLPQNNFTFQITSATCNGSNNGSISITALDTLNYTATITGNGLNMAYPFTNSQNIANLSAGTYSVCITLAGQIDYSQCYSAVITEPQPLSVSSTINNTKNTVSLSLSGSSQYNIILNGKLYTTNDSLFTLPLVDGNNIISVSTDRACQGVVQKSINFSSKIIPYPDPFQNTLNINLGSENFSQVIVGVYSVANGKMVYSKQYFNQQGVLQIDLSGSIMEKGVYALQISINNTQKIFKIIKQ